MVNNVKVNQIDTVLAKCKSKSNLKMKYSFGKNVKVNQIGRSKTVLARRPTSPPFITSFVQTILPLSLLCYGGVLENTKIKSKRTLLGSV